MSKISHLKFARLFEQADNLPHTITRRDKPLVALSNLSPGNCYICHLPVLASHGQLLKWIAGKDGVHLYSHKQCRKNQ